VDWIYVVQKENKWRSVLNTVFIITILRTTQYQCVFCPMYQISVRSINIYGFMTTVVCALHSVHWFAIVYAPSLCVQIIQSITEEIFCYTVICISILHSVMSQTNEILILPIATGYRKGSHPRVY
jgi:hypothetical protein